MRRHFISYPKSGRTWIRYVFTQLGCESRILFHHDTFEFNDGARPPHDFSLERRLEKYSVADRLVYLERTPQDVMVSLFHQVTGRFRDFFDYRGTLPEFIRDDYFGAANLRRFRNMWTEIVDRRGYLKISYEDCHRNLEETVRRVADYYELEVTPRQLADAVAQAGFDNMKALEQSGRFPEPWLRPRNDCPKVRSGLVGGYRSVLDASDIAYLRDIFGDG